MEIEIHKHEGSPESRLSEVRKIEKETGVAVPRFVSKWPAVEEEKAVDLAYEYDLVDKEILVNRYGDLQHEDARWHASRAGLRYCRGHQVGIEKAFEKAEEWEKHRPSSWELLAMFNEASWDRRELAKRERQRRRQRDEDILAMEVGLLRRRGIEVPDFDNLLEYCEWIPENTGVSEDWLQHHSKQVVYWDLMGHYSKIIKGAERSFDPLNDWRLYLEGKKDITDWKECDLQNMGYKNISYYAVSVKRGGGARTHSYEDNYPGVLLTHTTSLNAGRAVVESSYLEPRVCLSVGLVTFNRTPPRISFVFDKRDLKEVYSVRRYGEPGGGHEKELRAREPVHVGFALACVPTSETIFPDFVGAGQGTTSRGADTLAKWEDNYLQNSRLWDDREYKMIEEIARNHEER